MPTHSTHIPLVCPECGANFSVTPSRFRGARGYTIYCGSVCSIRGRSKKLLQDPIKRFWANIAKSDTCWLWTAGKVSTGYGNLTINGKFVAAHRFSWELHFGPILDGLHVLHHCDTPACVRPSHLFLGTAKDNRQDCANKGRLQRGESHFRARLTIAEVLAIRAAYAKGTRPVDLAGPYGVAVETIHAIVHRRSWKHI